MTGGVVSRGKSRVTRDRTSSPPESTRKTLSRTARNYASCPFFFFLLWQLAILQIAISLSRLLHKRYEDGSTGGQQRWKRGTAGYRVDVNTGCHDDLRASIHRCFDHRRHRSSESDARDDQMPPRDPEDVLWGT